MPNDPLADWQKWGTEEKPKLIKKFSSGLNQNTLLVEIDGKKRVLKHFHQPNKSAIEVQKLVAHYQLSPAIYYADSNGHYLLMDYLKPLTDSTLVDNLDKLAATLRSLHTIPIKPTKIDQFNFQRYCRNYLQTAKYLDHTILDELNDLQQHLSKPLGKFQADNSAYCLCHNDLVTDNILLTEKAVQLIDWEYAQLNNPWFDLAAVTVYLSLSKAQALNFLTCYFDTPTDEITQLLLHAQCAVLWLDILWTLQKTGQKSWQNLTDKRKQLLKLAESANLLLN